MSNSNLIFDKFISKYTNLDFFKDIINIFLYPSDFSTSVGGSSESDSLPAYLNSFFIDLQKKLSQYGNSNKNIADKMIDASRTILKLRDAGKGLITYNSIDQHFVSTNALIKKLIQEVKDSKIETDDDFRQKINNIIVNIKYYYDFQVALSGMTKIHEYLDLVEKQETSPIEAVEKYKEMSLQLDSDMSTLSTCAQDETTTDYYVLSDKESVSQISDSIVDYLCDNYSFYNTGLEAYDQSVDGFESSSVHLIASPSNGGKSITLSNLFYRIANQNKKDFDENDAALYITCEDDTIKTTRKFISIFGNYEFSNVRNIYRASHEYFTNIKKEKKVIDPSSKTVVKNFFDELLFDAVNKTTENHLKIIFKYAPENSYSAGDIQRQIKKFQLQGINIKYIIIDYLDVLKPTLSYGNNVSTDEYATLGINLFYNTNQTIHNLFKFTLLI